MSERIIVYYLDEERWVRWGTWTKANQFSSAKAVAKNLLEDYPISMVLCTPSYMCRTYSHPEKEDTTK